ISADSRRYRCGRDGGSGAESSARPAHLSLRRHSVAGGRIMIEAFAEDSVRGFLHRPQQPSGDAIALTHGAGSNCQAPLLLAVAEAFSAAAFTVLRFDLPFRQARPGGPPRPGDAALDRQGIRAAATVLRRFAAGR